MPAGNAAAPGAAPLGMGARLYELHCTRCHGPEGRGDGPDGAALATPDLSRPAWQRTATDDAVASVIRAGRGAMPPSRLGEPSVRAIVAYVRSLGEPTPNESGVPAAASSGSGPSQGLAAPSSAGPPPRGR